VSMYHNVTPLRVFFIFKPPHSPIYSVKQATVTASTGALPLLACLGLG